MNTSRIYLVVMSASVFFAPLGALGQQWTSKGPIDRFYHSAVLDTTTNRMIVFGGAAFEHSDSGSGGPDLNDVWLLYSAATATSDALTWNPTSPVGAPPAPRLGHTAVYNSASNRMIVFGGGLGLTSPCANDTWVLENANGKPGSPAWAQLSPSGSAPSPRILHTGVYDAGSNTMIVYGGLDCFSTFFGDVWVLSNADGTGGTSTWSQLLPAGSGPGGRENHNAVYDSKNNIMIVFGGSSASAAFNDVWTLSHANGQGGAPAWTQLSPSGSLPTARAASSSVYDPGKNTMTVFAGSDITGNLNDTWVLSHANGLGGTPAWTQLSGGSTTPEARFGHSAVYNPLNHVMTIFGGRVSGNLGTSDVFFLQHANGQ